MNTETTNSFTIISQDTGREIELSMQSLFLTGKIIPVGAKLIVEHKFVCAEDNPIEVVYSFGLPRNSTLRRFKVKSQNFVVESRLENRNKVRRIYEKAIKEGHLAVQAQRYRDGIVNLTVGNILPEEEVRVYLEILAGVDIRDDGFRFRFPFTLAPCYHSLARVCETEPGTGEIELPEDQFGDVFLPVYKKDPNGLHIIGFNIAVEMPEDISEINSPSHPIKIGDVKPNIANIALSTEKDIPNRDLVVDVRTKKPIMCAACDKNSNGKTYFYAIYPSTIFEKNDNKKAAANVVFVIDRSGSMEGTPIDQAKRAAKACLTALDPEDRFTVIAFDDSIETLSNVLIAADKDNVHKAFAFIEGIYARGGTELGSAIIQANEILKSSKVSGGTIFVITDGQVYATEDIIITAKHQNSRLYCLGIGSASQDRFIDQLASETGGNSVFITPRERIEEEALKLFDGVKSHLGEIINYKFNSCGKIDIEPDFKGIIFSGKPIVIFGETSEPPNGSIELSISKNGKSFVKTLPLKSEVKERENLIKLLRGARIIDSIESQLGAIVVNAIEETEASDRLAKESKKYQLASRVMGLVAVIKRTNNNYQGLPKTRVVPVGMPEDVQWDAYFYQKNAPVMDYSIPMKMDNTKKATPIKMYKCIESPKLLPAERDIYSDKANTIDHLFDLVSKIEPDGGMPGDDFEERIKKTILALFEILDNGKYAETGVLRLHVRKMLRFLKQYETNHPIITRVIYIAESGLPVPVGWKNIDTTDRFYEQLEMILNGV
ncbi:MAG: VWA domain-containing protein [Verrucomicrobiia bacterium]